MLVIFSGLPGTGTTTIAKAVAASRTVVYPRVDAIEHALAQGASPAPEIGPVGYLAATDLCELPAALRPPQRNNSPPSMARLCPVI
jgi:hypothetical protein